MPSRPSRSAMSMRTRSGRSEAASASALAAESAVPTTSYPSRRSRSSTSSATTASSSTIKMRAGFAEFTGSAPSDHGLRLLADGERQREPGPANALDQHGPLQLPDERRHQALPERPGTLPTIRRRGKPDAVVLDDEGRGAIGAMERDRYRPTSAFGKRVLQGVREQLVQDQPAGDCDIEVEGHRLDIERELDRATPLSRRGEDVP